MAQDYHHGVRVDEINAFTLTIITVSALVMGLVWTGNAATQSIAGGHQKIIAPVVCIGSEKINVAQLMLDTVALVQQLADQLASHTHPSTGQPTNSNAIAQSGQQAAALSTKYSPVIG